MEQRGKPDPPQQVLVAYASRYGSTLEIAEHIARVLRASGIDTEVQPAEEVIRVGPYDAVVLGSGVYNAYWLPEAVELFESFQEELATKPLWLFCDGPTGGGAQPQGEMRRFPENLAVLVAATEPEEIALFGGNVDPNRLSANDRLAYHASRGGASALRDWQAVEAWSMTIAARLQTRLAVRDA